MASLSSVATDKKWDVNDIVISIDGIVPDIYASGDVFTLEYDQDHITISSDVYGNGIRIINHNGQATLTVNVSRLSNIYAKMMEADQAYYDAQHTITITTPVERITTTTASIQKKPNISAGNEAPNASIAFKCINADASAV